MGGTLTAECTSLANGLCPEVFFFSFFLPLGVFYKVLVTILGRLQNKMDELPDLVSKILYSNHSLFLLNTIFLFSLVIFKLFFKLLEYLIVMFSKQV